MVFKKAATEYLKFDEESFPQMSELLEKSLGISFGPCGDIVDSFQEVDTPHQPRSKRGKGGKKNRRDEHYIVRDFLLALVLCHNVTPTYPDPDNPEYKEYQASSPDEIALVKFAD